MALMEDFLTEVLIRYGREGYIRDALNVRPSFWLLATDQGLMESSYTSSIGTRTYRITDKGLELING